MSAEKTKQHFAEICECLWDKAQYQEKLDKEVVSAMRKFIANFTMIAWNACIMQKTYSDVKKFLKKFTEENFGSGHSASQYVFDAAELKWREYREDTDTIASVDVKVVDGKPQAIAYLKDECPEKSSARNPFFEYLNSMGIQTQWGVNMEDCPDKTASLHNFLPFTSPFIIEDEDDDCPDYELIEEEYDFDEKNLHVLQLAGLLLPALQSARNLGIQTACSNSMKQMGLAASLYSMQNDEWNMPFQGGDSGGSRWPMNGEFTDLMKIKTPGYGYWDERFVCPNTSRRNTTPGSWTGGMKYAPYAYGMTRWGGNLYPEGSGTAENTSPQSIYRRTKIWSPSSKFLFLEATGGAYANN